MKKLILKTINVLGYEITKKQKSSQENDPEYDTYKKILDVPGFLSFNAFKLFGYLEKISKKNEAIKNLNVLEIGVFCGRSLLGLGLIFRRNKVIGVDPFYESFKDSPAFEEEANYLGSNSDYQDRNTRLHKLTKKSEWLGIKNNVEVQTVTQEIFLETKVKEKYQLIYVDGEHTFKSIAFFLNTIDTVLTVGGFLVVDDFLSFGFPGISEALHTHSSFKKDLFPVCYGFNKAVFVYKPSELYLIDVINGIKTFIQDNRLKSHKCDNDDSLVILE